MTRLFLLSCLASVSFFALAPTLPTARAHVPVPESVLDPQTEPEAWNVLRLVTDNSARLLREERLAELPNQIALCSPALRALARLRPDAPVVAAGAVRGTTSVNAAAQAALVGDRPGAENALAALRAALTEMASAFDARTLRADIFFCPMHAEIVSPDPAAPCPKCGMGLSPRRIPYSFIYIPPGEPSVRLTVRTATPLAVGRLAQATVRLEHRDGSPVLLSDLEIVHTQPIHLLVVDPATREDYHHEHPVPTEVPGEYAFTFTPARPTAYRVFADIVPGANGIQELPFADLPGAKNSVTVAASPATVRHGDSLTSEASGLIFRLQIGNGTDPSLAARQTHRLRLLVNDADGRPFGRLEPVMNAFAHLVGFYDDGQTVVHLHPAGGEVTDSALRGGPAMDFPFYPPRPGHLRLFCQVQVDGRQVFARFDVEVRP